MEKQKASKENRTKVKRQRTRRVNPDSIAPDYVPSTLPSRDMEVPTVTTVHTVEDYLKADMATPRDPQFADKLVAVPIPTENRFVGTGDALSEFLAYLATATEEETPYLSGEIALPNQEIYVVLQLRERYFPGFPSRIVLLPKDPTKRTFGVYATEKVLVGVSAPVEAAVPVEV